MAEPNLPPSLAGADPDTGLLPCPFCGAPGTMNSAGRGVAHTAECSSTDCEGSAGSHNSPSDAAAAWNRRSAPPALPPEPTPEMVEEGAAVLGAALVSVLGPFHAVYAKSEDICAQVYRAMARAHGEGR